MSEDLDKDRAIKDIELWTSTTSAKEPFYEWTGCIFGERCSAPDRASMAARLIVSCCFGELSSFPLWVSTPGLLLPNPSALTTTIVENIAIPSSALLFVANYSQ